MIVSELIERLRNLPQNVPVCFENLENGKKWEIEVAQENSGPFISFNKQDSGSFILGKNEDYILLK